MHSKIIKKFSSKYISFCFLPMLSVSRRSGWFVDLFERNYSYTSVSFWQASWVLFAWPSLYAVTLLGNCSPYHETYLETKYANGSILKSISYTFSHTSHPTYGLSTFLKSYKSLIFCFSHSCGCFGISISAISAKMSSQFSQDLPCCSPGNHVSVFLHPKPFGFEGE